MAAACTKCHILAGGRARSRARGAAGPGARPFRARAAPLQADCASCHPGIEASKVSKDLNFKGIQSCRECHKPFQASQDCRECHLFHPKAVP